MENNHLPDTSDQATPVTAPWSVLKLVGPGLVTACAVIGPGSILTSSKVGASDGYSKIWVVILAAFFMMIYITLAARLGVVAQQSTGDLVRSRMGGWLAILLGFSVFFISAAFQFGNNLGVHSALSAYSDFDYWIVVLNVASISFVFVFRNLYRIVERLMMGLVGLMLVCFTLNLCFAQPNLGELAAGILPFRGETRLELPLLGLVGTTFAITAAYYQSYLVRFKGWTQADLRTGMIDTRIGSAILLLITLMIMATAAAVLRGKDLASVSDVAGQLQPLFGEKGRAIFCVGLFAAAFSSFIVNSMIGGFILADALKLGSTPEERGPRVLTVAVLLVGMLVALYVIQSGTKPFAAIVAAQAITVIAAPLLAATLLWLTNLPGVMGEHRNGPWMNLAATAGLLLLISMAWYTATYKVWPEVYKLLT